MAAHNRLVQSSNLCGATNTNACEINGFQAFAFCISIFVFCVFNMFQTVLNVEKSYSITGFVPVESRQSPAR